MFNPFKKLFKSKIILEAEEVRDLTNIEEEIQVAADNVDVLIQRRAQRAVQIASDAKLKAEYDRISSQRFGRGGRLK